MRKINFQRNNSELGFGSKNTKGQSRFLNRDGTVNVRRKGKNVTESYDVFHSLLTMSWSRLLLIISCCYVAINFIFACIYTMIGPEQFGNINLSSKWKSFEDLFFFSAQTLTTVGYGYVYPKGGAVSTVAAIESMLGLLSFAIATGLLYGRFSRPNVTINYSEKMLISPYRGITGLMFRIANPKRNELIEIEAQVVVSMINPETNTRVFMQLPLERDKINFLSINWTVVHPIDELSPLYGLSIEDIQASEAEFMILIKAMNDTYSQNVYSRTSYKAHEIMYGAKFKPFSIAADKRGKTVVDITMLSEYDDAELPALKIMREAE